MMGNIAARLWIVTALVVVAYGATRLVQEPPEVKLPNWTFREMPYQLGAWHGEDTEMDPRITASIGAANVVNRLYRDEVGRTISSHTAIFPDPLKGLSHSPIHCYRSAGWEKISETSAEVSIGENRTIPVSVVTYERNGERVLVGYWYQIGERVLFDRLDMAEVRWAMRGQSVWPATVKVLLQISVAGDPDDTKTCILAFAEQIGKWINHQPSHQTQLGDERET